MDTTSGIVTVGTAVESVEQRSKALGARIWKAIKDKGLTIQDAAAQTGLWHRDSLARLVRGEGSPPRVLEGRLLADKDPRYTRLAEILGLDPSTFVQEVKSLQEAAESARRNSERPMSGELVGPQGVPSRPGAGQPSAVSDGGDELGSVLSDYESTAFEGDEGPAASARASLVARLVRAGGGIARLPLPLYERWTWGVDRMGAALASQATEGGGGAHGAPPPLTFGFDGRAGASSGMGARRLPGMARDLRLIHKALRERRQDERVLGAVRRIGVIADGCGEDYDQVVQTILSSLAEVEAAHKDASHQLVTVRSMLPTVAPVSERPKRVGQASESAQAR